MRHDSAELQHHEIWHPSRIRAVLYPILRSLYAIGIYGLPLAAVIGLFSLSDMLWYRCVVGALAPAIYSTLFVIAAGTLSMPHQHAIIQGQFPRRTDHPVYFHRRLYGVCWTSLYYCTPMYGLCLTIPWMKTLAFRLFGYRGSMDFTIYPDTWIRDLPLLSFGPGVYVSNRATLGTNMVLPNHHILVRGIHLDEGALIGHLSLIGPGVRVGKGTEIGVCVTIGVNTSIGDRVHIGPLSGIGHEVRIAARVHVGGGSIIDTRASIHEGAHLPAGTIVAAGSAHAFLHAPDPSVDLVAQPIGGTGLKGEVPGDLPSMKMDGGLPGIEPGE